MIEVPPASRRVIMASIQIKKGKHYVVYNYTDETGARKQKWEPCKSEAHAKKRKKEIEYKEGIGQIILPQCKTVDELMAEYTDLYGKTKWSLSVFSSNKALIKNYIAPFIGNMKLNEITTHVLERFYQRLLKTESVKRVTDSKFSKDTRYVGTSTVRDVHKLLRSAFTQAMKWDLIDKNPAALAEVPKHQPQRREIWDLQTLSHANEVCPDNRLKLCINLSFSCSLRMGELLGLTWDCVDVSEESIKEERAYIYVNKELQRATRDAITELENKGVIKVFPEKTINTKTILVLKTPKTPSSFRKVYLPTSVAEMLVQWKQDQEEAKEALGDEYSNYDLVIASPLGSPVEHGQIEKSFKDFIKHYELPEVVFHSLRHSSITYKLKLTGGDIKAVQGDSGHSQAQMVTDQYSHILDESRKDNARLLENAFYRANDPEPRKKEETNESAKANAQPDPEVIKQILGDPDMLQLLMKLSKTLGK